MSDAQQRGPGSCPEDPGAEWPQPDSSDLATPLDARSRWIGRLGALAVAGMVLIGVAVRALPLLTRPGLWTVPIDADNGVYFGASALLWRGVTPYSDFVFLHPAMGAYIHMPAGLAAHLSVETGFVVARWTAVAMAAMTMGILAALLWRRVGRVAAFAGVAIYAVYPEIVRSDRGPFLEPVQNLFGVLLVLVWTSQWGSVRRRVLVSGVVLGALVATKYTSGLFLLACLASLPGDNTRQRVRHALELGGSAFLAFLVLMLPWLVRAPLEVIRQTISAHLGRGDGLRIGLSDRVVSVFDPQLAPIALRPTIAGVGLVAVLGAAVLFAFSGGRLGRFVATTLLVEVAFLLIVGQYWPQYNAVLALPLAITGGWASQQSWRWLRSGQPIAGVVAAALIASFLLFFVNTAWVDTQARSNLIPGLRDAASTLPDGCVLGLPADTLLAVGQLAPEIDGQYLLDPYGAFLFETGQAGLPLASVTIQALEICNTVLVDPDWAAALGPMIKEQGFETVADIPVDGRSALVLIRR